MEKVEIERCPKCGKLLEYRCFKCGWEEHEESFDEKVERCLKAEAELAAYRSKTTAELEEIMKTVEKNHRQEVYAFRALRKLGV